MYVCIFSVYEKFQATRAKVALVNLFYGATLLSRRPVSYNKGNLVKSGHLQEI